MKDLVAAWNPAYAVDAMDATVSPLLDFARQGAAGKIDDDDDVYVWWGKVRSANRLQPLAHIDQVLALDEALRGATGEAGEMDLHLTDYLNRASATTDTTLYLPGPFAVRTLHRACPKDAAVGNAP